MYKKIIKIKKINKSKTKKKLTRDINFIFVLSN